MSTAEPTLFDRLTTWAKNNRWIVALLAIAAAAALIASLSRDVGTIVELIESKETVSYPLIPMETGWILHGHFDTESNTFKSEYAEVYQRPGETGQISKAKGKQRFPEKGDIVRVLKERNLVILDYKTNGMAQRLVPPWQVPTGELRDLDYTGVKFPVGSLLEVRDVQPGRFPGNPQAAVWIRVGTAKP